MNICILYYSKTGHTLNAAKAISKGILENNNTSFIMNEKTFDLQKLKDADSIIIGTPCWAGSISSNGIAYPLKKVLKKLPDDIFENKKCGYYALYAISGEQTTLRTLEKTLKEKGCTNINKGFSAKAGTPFSVTIGKSISESDLDLFKQYGKSF